MKFQRAASTAIEIDLIGKREAEAKRDLERFIDSALLSGVPFVRIVHGKGEGILRKMVYDLLRKHPEVRSIEDAIAPDGGGRATGVHFD
mgnify:CR=1 FL=1